MKHSEQLGELAGALVLAQKAFSPAVKAKANPAFRGSLYVDLAAAIDAAQPALLENGIAVLQGTEGDIAQQSITVTTRVLHKSGQWIEDSLTLPACNRGDFSAQSAGSAITYARRYGYMAILGFAPEDDDGNGASHAPAPQQNAPAPPTARSAPQQSAPQGRQTGTISEPQSKRFFAIAKQAGKSDDDIRRYCLNVLHIDKSMQMPRDKYEAACKWAEDTSPGRPEPEDLGITDDDIPF